MLPDPRVYSRVVTDEIIALAEQSLAAEIAVQQEKLDQALRVALRSALRAGEGARLAQAISHAPGPDIARHIWRRLAEAFAQSADATLVSRLFALPVVLVAAARKPLQIAGLLSDTAALRSSMQEHGALAGNRNFTLSNALVGSAALGPERLPELLAWQALPTTGSLPQRVLDPAPIEVTSPHETVHLRFLVGAAVVGAQVDLFGRAEVGKWGMPLARQISEQLAQPDLTLLALPGAPASPVLAWHAGRAAQREVGLQLYASNAIREIRGKVGEPCAVLSAHRAPDAPGGGELRVSLSSPFNSDAGPMAEGFHCPLHGVDRVADVERTILALLQDCRVSEVHVLPQLFPDRDPEGGARLFFRSETLGRIRDFALQ
jgi:hypothetical protein